MIKKSNDFQIKRFGEDIITYPITKPLDTGIQFGLHLPGCVPEYESWSAGISANCDMDRWDSPNGYSDGFRTKVVAWYRLSNALSAHSKDAQNIEAERQSRKKT